MKKRLLLFLLPIFLLACSSFFSAALASDTFVWVGGNGEWTNPANWYNQDEMMGNTLPSYDGDVIIDGNVTVTLSAPANFTLESVVLSGGASLIIADGATLNTRKGGSPGSNGFRLDGTSGNESTLTVYGTLNINNNVDRAPRDGLDINKYTSVVIGPAGALNIARAGEHAIEISDGLINYGSILITSPTGAGIFADGGINNSLIDNYGTITISAGTTGIDLNGSISMVNNGFVELSGASGKLIDGNGSFVNNGVLSGNGAINATYFLNGASGSVLAPGTSVGTLFFDDDVDLYGASLNIEIDGASSPGSDYDQLIVDGALNLNGATLDISGAHIPSSGDVLTIINKAKAGAIAGTFNGLPEGATINLNGFPLSISYTGGNGNDVTLSFSVFPVELIGFRAKASGKEVGLSWSTATETNNDFFAVEHSRDGKNFSEIGRVHGAGNSLSVKHYSFVHRTPSKGINYYRLHQFDFDGASEFSKIEAVSFEGQPAWAIRQTLVRGFLAIEGLESLETPATLAIFNLSGQKMYQQDISPAEQQQQWEIPVSGWPAGAYLLQLRSEGHSSAQRFVVQ